MNTALLELAEKVINERIESKPLFLDIECWQKCLGSIPKNGYVSLAYKPDFINYQKAYFSDVYDEYVDLSRVLYRGGKPVGIWPLCIYRNSGKVHFGSNGGVIVEPLFTCLPKAEAQRKMIQSIIDCFAELYFNINEIEEELSTQVVITDDGSTEWQRKWMELGAKSTRVSWCAFADLSMEWDEIQNKIRRTNKYSIAKGGENYDVEIFDKDDISLSEIFHEFHAMHVNISGRETRSQRTWDIQEQSVRNNSETNGYDFVVFIKDKNTKELVGSALFQCTPQTGLYAVAAYDRGRFAKPVGHIVQAVAMNYMKKKGVRWYEIGERNYPSDDNVNEKLINIGKYKEGFATHMFPKITIGLKKELLRGNQ